MLFVISNYFLRFFSDFLYHEKIELFPDQRMNCCLFQESFVIFKNTGDQDVYQKTLTRF